MKSRFARWGSAVAASTALALAVAGAPAASADTDDDQDAGYLWAHFAVDGGYEKVFFGHSEDGLHWEKLNENQPILENLESDLGVRDPHIIRSPEGDKYWIIGTDLHAEGGGEGGSGWDQQNASQNLVVWESDDLVNWSDQRIVFAGFEDAGNVWAPEAIYNEKTDEYYVYWAGRDRNEVDTEASALRVYLTKTEDFKTFTEAEEWISLNDGDGGPNIIDTTIAEEDGVYYRFSTSDWHTVVDTATDLDGPWDRVIDRGEAGDHGLNERIEGLTVYELPDGRWAVMGDDGGYIAHVADNLKDLEFEELAPGDGDNQYSFDETFRHGTVLPLTPEEEARVLDAFGEEEYEPQGLLAEYDFEDGDLTDNIGDADLTAHGEATVTEDDEQGNVLSLDGSDDTFAEFPEGFFDRHDQLTISMDMKSEQADGNFFSFAFGQDNDKYYFMRARGGEFRSAITKDSWNNESAVSGSLDAGEWNHYDIVFDDNTMKVYVNGVKAGENDDLDAKVSNLGTGLSGYLGKSFYSDDGYFEGAFDNIRIYDEALSDDELIGEDQLTNVSLTDGDALKIDPIVSGSDHTVVFPVEPGTDLTKLAPTFDTSANASVSPESGTTVDLTDPVDYTLELSDGSTADWSMKAVEMKSPVLPGYYADPNIIAFDDTYYIYATSDGYEGWGGDEFYVWKSKDLVNWERGEEPFLKLDNEDGNVPWASGNGWAPTIIERDGKYYFYFSGHNDEVDRKTMGVAVADSPEGPFTAEPEPMVMNDEEVTSGQAIDPAAFRDPESGKYFLYWGNGNPVYAELEDDMVSLKPDSIKEMDGLTDYREATFMNYRDGRYHLTYSIDDTGSPDYRIGYATSDSPHGPWEYQGVILEKDPSLGILGTGHNSVLNVPGTDDWYMVYHRFAIPDGDGTHRETTIDRLTFDEDGYMEEVTPTLESVDPQFIETDGGGDGDDEDGADEDGSDEDGAGESGADQDGAGGGDGNATDGTSTDGTAQGGDDATGGDGELPVTGSESLALSVLALLLLTAGAGVLMGRRHQAKKVLASR